MKGPIRLDDLLHLPRPERARFAKALIESLEEEHHKDAEAVWAAELERRALESRANPEALEDWVDVRNRLLSDLNKA